MTGLLQNVAFISMPGGGEWMVILIIGLLIFGRRLPEVARGLGKSVNEFKKGMREFQESADEVARDVNKVTSEVATDVKEAAGVNDGDHEPSTATDYNTGNYTPYTPPVSDTPFSDVSEPAPATSNATEASDSETADSSTDKQDPTPPVTTA